jgi:hypothetical protein
VNPYDDSTGNPELPHTIRRQRKRRRATAIFLFSSTAALSVAVAGGSWLLSSRLPATQPSVERRSDTPISGADVPPIPEVTPQIGISIGQTDANGFSLPTVAPQFSAASNPGKMFAGKWRGTIHNTGPQSSWNSNLEFVVDRTETRWNNMNGGTVTRHGRTLSYRRSYRLGTQTNVQIHADLVLYDDDKTASYRTSEVSVTGKVRSRTFGSGTLEKVE